MDISTGNFIFWSCSGLKDKNALGEQQDRQRVEDRVVGEKDEVVLENGSPYQSYQDEDAGLRENGCEMSVRIMPATRCLV